MENEQVRDEARAIMRTGLFKRSMVLRRQIERLFAELKTQHALTRLHLRGRSGAEEVFLIAAATMNLRLLARPKKVEQTRRARRPYTGREHVMERISLAQPLTSLPMAA